MSECSTVSNDVRQAIQACRSVVAGVCGAVVSPGGFRCGGGGQCGFGSLAKEVAGAIDAAVVVAAEVVVNCCPAAGPGLDEVGSVRGNFEYHVASVIADDGIGVCM